MMMRPETLIARTVALLVSAVKIVVSNAFKQPWSFSSGRGASIAVNGIEVLIITNTIFGEGSLL